jgi:hypothetical protein
MDLLKHLFLKEVSGVDDPAHGAPGWMVAKAAGSTDPTAAWDGFYAICPGGDITKLVTLKIEKGMKLSDAVAALTLAGADPDSLAALSLRFPAAASKGRALAKMIWNPQGDLGAHLRSDPETTLAGAQALEERTNAIVTGPPEARRAVKLARSFFRPARGSANLDPRF